MLVDLVCVIKCQCDATGRVEFFDRDRKVSGVEVSGKEPWLKYFNAYKHVAPVEVKVIEPAILTSFDGEQEESAVQLEPAEPEAPSAEDVGGYNKLSIDQIVAKFTPEAMVLMLKESGNSLASIKWKPATLAKHVQGSGIYLDKL